MPHQVAENAEIDEHRDDVGAGASDVAGGGRRHEGHVLEDGGEAGTKDLRAGALPTRGQLTAPIWHKLP